MTIGEGAWGGFTFGPVAKARHLAFQGRTRNHQFRWGQLLLVIGDCL